MARLNTYGNAEKEMPVVVLMVLGQMEKLPKMTQIGILSHLIMTTNSEEEQDEQVVAVGFGPISSLLMYMNL